MTQGHEPAGEPIGPHGRTELLVEMYRATWANITRHVTVSWQAVGVLGTAVLSAFALGATDELAPEQLDLIAALTVVTACWVAANALDAGEWFNRNVQIIANVEDALLAETDKGAIHPYIGFVRSNETIQHFRLQVVFSLAIAFLVFLAHWHARGLTLSGGSFDLTAVMPIGAAVLGGFYVVYSWCHAHRNFEEFRVAMERHGKTPEDGRPFRFCRMCGWLRSLFGKTEGWPAIQRTRGDHPADSGEPSGSRDPRTIE